MFTVPIRCEIKKVEVSRCRMDRSISLSDWCTCHSYPWIKHRFKWDQPWSMNFFVRALHFGIRAPWARTIVWWRAVSYRRRKHEVKWCHRRRKSPKWKVPLHRHPWTNRPRRFQVHWPEKLQLDGCSLLETSDLVETDSIEVFTIKAEERGFLAPQASVTFPIEFSAPIAGTFQEEYTLVFDPNIPEVCSARISAIRAHRWDSSLLF